MGVLPIPHALATRHQVPHARRSRHQGTRLFPKDLYSAIERGEYPKWSLEVQTMTAKEAEDLWEKEKTNVFDLTRVWLHEQFPLRKVGEFTLNENAKNYFAEIEQAAFNPSHLVPGIEPSADPVLQSRLYSYADIHRHRVGVNYQQLPVNAPRPNYRMANFQRDGNMAFLNQGSRLNYIRSIEPIHFRERCGRKCFGEDAKERFVGNVAGHMTNCREEEIIRKQIAIFREVSGDLANRREKATGLKGYEEIGRLSFNGKHNGMRRNGKKGVANGMKGKGSGKESNWAPVRGSHGLNRNGVAAH